MEIDASSVSTSRGRVLVVSILLDGWLFFIGRALSRAGYDVTFVTTTDPALGDPDHRDILKYFLPKPFCHLVDLKDAAQLAGKKYDFAVVGIYGATSFEEKRRILDAIGATPLRGIVLRHYNTELPAMVRLVLKETVHPFIRRAPRVLVEEYGNASWMLRFLAPVSELGIVTHQRVTCQGMPDGLLDRVERDYLFNFLGSYDGPRVFIIDQLEAYLHISTGGAHKINLGGKSVDIVWHADRPGSRRARPLNEYLDTLCNSYFTLCLPGHTVLTHRVLEAIHCGSIPILSAEAMPRYLLPFRHGHNCWLVTNNNWKSALVALSALDRAQILEMQRAVKALAQNEASIPALDKRCLEHLGLSIFS